VIRGIRKDLGFISRVLLRRKAILLAALVVTLASCTQYIITMLIWTTPGFTLDDSWIHLAFARSIYEGRPWQYSPGYPSTGSTSPLWSIVLWPLFYVTTDPIGLVWGTIIIATLLYCFCSFIVGLTVYTHTKSDLYSCLAIIGFVLVPRNTWLMLSGMETPLFVSLIFLAILLSEQRDAKYDFILGIVCGLAFLSRPEAVLLLAILLPARVFVLTRYHQTGMRRAISVIMIPLIALAIAAPWILYCYSTTGFPLPDTIYSKSHIVQPEEYVYWIGWWIYWLNTMPFLIVGALSGVVLARRGHPHTWLMAIAMIVLYHFTAPYNALINNARYLVPIFDLLMVTAISGLAILLLRVVVLSGVRSRLLHVLPVVVILAIVVLPVVPDYMFQANFFGNSVKNINEQQVHIGYWLRNNTPQDAVLAIHDAGALRFFSNRTVMDIAGLVSPQIAHGHMTNTELVLYLRDHGCDYFVFFDDLFAYWGWAYFSGAYEKLYTVHLVDNVISGRDTMSVFYINWTLTVYGPRTG